MTIAHISIALLSRDPLNTRARPAVTRTWDWLASTDEWTAWLGAHLPDDVFTVVTAVATRDVIRDGCHGDQVA